MKSFKLIHVQTYAQIEHSERQIIMPVLEKLSVYLKMSTKKGALPHYPNKNNAKQKTEQFYEKLIEKIFFSWTDLPYLLH